MLIALDSWDFRLAAKKDELHIALDIPKQAAIEIYNWVQGQDWLKGTELEPLEKYHITMLFAQGDGAIKHKDDDWIEHKAHAVTLKSLKEFPPSEERDGLRPIVLLVESDTIHAHHNALAENALERDIDIGPYVRGKYVPHMTIGYGPELPKGLKPPKLTFETEKSSVSEPRDESGVMNDGDTDICQGQKTESRSSRIREGINDEQNTPSYSENFPNHIWSIAHHRAPYEAELLKLADSWQPRDQWPNALRERAFEPRSPDCTCEDGHKLDCPVHGMHPTLPTYDDTLEFPDPSSPVGYDYHTDGPRTWMRAETKTAVGPYQDPQAYPLKVQHHDWDATEWWNHQYPWSGEEMYEDFKRRIPIIYVPSTHTLHVGPGGGTHESLQARADIPTYRYNEPQFHGWAGHDAQGAEEHGGTDPHNDPSYNGWGWYSSDHPGEQVNQEVEQALQKPRSTGWDFQSKKKRTKTKVEYTDGMSPHGTYARYTKQECRCEACKTAKTEYQRAWRLKNPQKDKEKNDRWKASHAEQIKAYKKRLAQEHPERGRQYTATRKARKLGQFVEEVDPLVVFERDEGICGICHDSIEGDFHVDHVIPLSKGGLHGYANVQAAHPDCNWSKHAKAPKRRLWLDDTRHPPDDSWDWARDAREAKKLTKDNDYDYMSLDHDLGIVRYEGKVVINPDALSGGDFALWLHEHRKHMPKSVNIHSHNDKGAKLMKEILESHTKVTTDRAADDLEEDWAREFKVHEPSEIEKEVVHLPEHTASHQLAWLPRSGLPGKGLVTPSGDVHTWPTDADGAPHHAEYLDRRQPYQLHEGTGHFFKIRPRGGLDTESYDMPPQIIHHVLQTVPSLRVGEHTDWHFGADEVDTREYDDARQMPPITQAPDATNPHPEGHGCTCPEGKKLTCPVHGLNPDPTQQGYDHSWSIPEGSPVGYPQNAPDQYKVNTGAVATLCQIPGAICEQNDGKAHGSTKEPRAAESAYDGREGDQEDNIGIDHQYSVACDCPSCQQRREHSWHVQGLGISGEGWSGLPRAEGHRESHQLAYNGNGYGKGIVTPEGEIHTWNTADEDGFPTHADYWWKHPDVVRAGHTFEIYNGRALPWHSALTDVGLAPAAEPKAWNFQSAVEDTGDEDEHTDNLEGENTSVPTPPIEIRKKRKEQEDEELVRENPVLHSGAWQILPPMASRQSRLDT